MKSQMVKKTFVIAGRKKSISLEEGLWKAVQEIASLRDMTLLALLAEIDGTRIRGNLSSIIRLFVLEFYREEVDLQNRQNAIQSVLRSYISELH